MSLAKILRSPALVMVTFALGAAVGLLRLPFIGVLSVFGDTFLVLLELCMLPIIATMLTLSIHRVLKARLAGRFMARMVAMSLLLVAGIFALTLLCSWGLKGVTFEHKDFLLSASKLLLEGEEGVAGIMREISTYIRPATAETVTVGEMIMAIFPNNIIRSFAESNVLQVVFFSIVLGGLSAGLPPKGEELVMGLCDSVNQIFLTLFDNIILFLAPATFCIVAVQISGLGLDVLASLIRLLGMIVAICLLLCLICLTGMCLLTKTSPLEHLRAMGKPLYTAFATSDAIPTIPMLLESLPAHHKIDRQVADTVIPICTTLFNYDGVILLAVSLAGASVVYDVPLSAGMLATALLMTFLLSTSYADLLTSAYLIALLLEPFGLPAEAFIAMLIPLNPILDGLFTATKLYPVCLTTAYMSRRADTADISRGQGVAV